MRIAFRSDTGPWLGVVVVLGLLAAPASAAAPAKPWNQQEVAQLAQRFTLQTKRIQEVVGKHLEEAEKNSPRRVVLHDVYEIHHRAVSLESGVRAGLGRDGTEPVFRRILSSVEHARQDAKRFPEIEEAREHIDEANRLLAELGAYYGEGG